MTPEARSVPDVLADRYASADLVRLWSSEHRVVLERRLWLAVLKAQAVQGLGVPAMAIRDYERVVEQVDLTSISRRERVTRHDVKARIEEFNALAGHEHVHKALTGRDVGDNVEQFQIRLSLEHARDGHVPCRGVAGSFGGRVGGV
ncbi:adenylosuccinate lyase, partial [Streptomyces lavendulae]